MYFIVVVYGYFLFYLLIIKKKKVFDLSCLFIILIFKIVWIVLKLKMNLG